MCVFHQRFSTNTTPQWRLCHPFRYLAHNGEINTISGNRKWALARAKKFQCEALPDIEEIAPLVNLKGSDSQSLDNIDRKCDVEGKSVSVRVDLGGRRIIQKQKI